MPTTNQNSIAARYAALDADAYHAAAAGDALTPALTAAAARYTAARATDRANPAPDFGPGYAARYAAYLTAGCALIAAARDFTAAIAAARADAIEAAGIAALRAARYSAPVND